MYEWEGLPLDTSRSITSRAELADTLRIADVEPMSEFERRSKDFFIKNRQPELRVLTSDEELYALLDLLDVGHPHQLHLLSGACDPLSVRHLLAKFVETVTGAEPDEDTLSRAVDGFDGLCNRIVAYYANGKVRIVRCVYDDGTRESASIGDAQ